MELKFKITDVQKKHIIMGFHHYVIKGKTDSASIEIELSEEEYKGLATAMKHIELEAILPVTIPGEAEY